MSCRSPFTVPMTMVSDVASPLRSVSKGFRHDHSGFHGARRQQHFRYENAIVFEVFSDDPHSCNETFIEDFHRGMAFRERVFRHLFDRLVLAFKQEADSSTRSRSWFTP